MSIQYPGREGSLATLAETRNLPSIDQMKGLIVTMLEEMTKSGNVERFNSQVILPGGSISDAEVVRVGVFNAITENFFLKFIPETQSLQVLARQPARRVLQVVVLRLCLLYTSPSPRDKRQSRMPSSA